MNNQFSADGKYFGQLTVEGKLKLWNVSSNTFEQEYTPDFHLKSPCTCLHFVEVPSEINKGSTPRKKRRSKRPEIDGYAPHIILGTSSGLLLAYSVTLAELKFKTDSGLNQPITCLSWGNKNLLYSGSEENILCWDLNIKTVKNKWKNGKEKITSLLVIPNNRLLVASRNINLWDIKSQQLLKSFTGHSSEVTIIQYVEGHKSNDEYFITGSKSDRVLSCWVVNDNNEQTTSVASFLMEDIAFTVSIMIGPDRCLNMAAVTRSGVAHIYQHALNGKLNKPLKPKTTLQVASDIGKGNSIVTPIPIVSALYQNDLTITICYGSAITLTFENVVINAYEKVQCLVRNVKTVTKEQQTKTRTPVIDDHVRYLTPYMSSAASHLVNTKRKGAQEVPMEKRLDNLSLNKVDKNSKVPKADNVAQLLIQGLHSKDKNMLRTVLSKRDEFVIKNTIKRLPVPVIAPLVHELTSYMEGKTLMTHIGSLWLKNLLQVHAGLLLSNPELSRLLGPVLSSVESRLSLQTPLCKLKGRLDLLISQVNVGVSQADDNEALLEYNDKDGSESDMEAFDLPEHLESDNDWVEEDSEQEKPQENGESESEMSVYELSE